MSNGPERLTNPKMDYYRTLYQKSTLLVDHQPLANKRLIVYCEQGLGDTIQFIRYLKSLSLQGAKLIVHCDPSLHSLLPYVVDCEVLNKGGAKSLPDHDLHVLSLDLPFHCLPAKLKKDYSIKDWWEGKISMDVINLNIPHCPYIHFDETVDLETDEFKIGVCWEGNPRNPLNEDRSCPLSLFADLPGEKFCLQKEVHNEALWDDSVELLGVEINDFKDTAKIINSVDAVVSVDTSVLHLAGALNKPTFGVLSGADPRWGENVKKSPWYPSVTFYPGDWKPVFRKVAEDLNSSKNRLMKSRKE